jgi:hypothetical protein
MYGDTLARVFAFKANVLESEDQKMWYGAIVEILAHKNHAILELSNK